MDWKKLKENTPLNSALLYTFLGGLWILFSDRFLEVLDLEPSLHNLLQTAKGWAFVGITACLFYGLMHFALRSLKESEQALCQSYSELEATHEELVAAEEELKQQFDEIQEREAYYRGIFEGISSGILVHDRSGHLIHSNDSAVRLLRLDRLLPQYRIDNDTTLYYTDLIAYLAREEFLNRSLLIEVFSEKEQTTWLLAHSNSVINEKTTQEEIITTLVDRTEDKKIGIFSSILNEMDHLVLKGTPLAHIEQVLCQRLVDQPDFGIAWIGRKETDGSVSMGAKVGIPGMELKNIRWDDSIYGQGAVGRAIRFGVPQSFLIDGNQYFAAWADYLYENGLHSIASFPLIHDGDVFGSFTLYSYTSDFFGPKLMTFFEHFTIQLALLFSQAQNREKIKENEARYREILAHMSNAVAVYDVIEEGEDFILKEFNSSAERTEQRLREEVLGKSVGTAFPYAESLGLLKAFKRVWLTGNSEQFSAYYEEEEFKSWREYFIYKLPNGELVTIYKDITDQKRIEEQIWRQAHHDTLTDLPNRLLFNEHLSLALARAKRKQGKCAILFLDLDRFKLINDTLGHSNGDLLLQLVSQRLQKGLYEGDTIGRLGGDEFLILLPELTHVADAATVAEKILWLFTEPFYLDTHEVFVSPSLGISLYPSDGENIEALLKHADTAMYHAKEQGRNNYQFFTQELNKKIHDRLTLENDLRKALDRKEFLLHYQPVVDLVSEQLVGVEALVRWQSPQRGLVSPGAFIPITEETGLIVPLGERILREACRQNFAWQKKGYPPHRIAVNISARQFREAGFVETVLGILEETGMDPLWLELEITESIAMGQGENTIQQLRQLREFGIRIAIDDFGTGFSSLNSLRRLPLTTLKIDQVFVREIGNDCNGEAILRSIIRLAKDLRLRIVAEGVEKQEQLEFLKMENCNEMQGYLFSRPLPSEEIEVLFKTNKKF